MAETPDRDLLEKLRRFDTPSITNVVATYPNNPLCLGLYHPWTENWYTDQRVRCMYPELGAVAGYAVTCVFGMPDPNFNRLSFMDVLEAMEASPQPTILAFEQKFPRRLAGKVGLAGGNMVTAMKAVGCIGAVSNGPSRDVEEIRPMKFQYLLSGVTPGHGEMQLHAVNAPVSISGMDVSPGEIIHMDEHGACKFPAEHLRAVHDNVAVLLAQEAEQQARMREATSAAELRAIFQGHAYGDQDKAGKRKAAKKTRRAAKKKKK